MAPISVDGVASKDVLFSRKSGRTGNGSVAVGIGLVSGVTGITGATGVVGTVGIAAGVTGAAGIAVVSIGVPGCTLFVGVELTALII